MSHIVHGNLKSFWQQPEKTILNLPTEILLHIAAYLPPSSLFSLGLYLGKNRHQPNNFLQQEKVWNVVQLPVFAFETSLWKLEKRFRK